MNNMDITDEELIILIEENSEIAKDMIFQKYGNLIDIYIKKYNRVINAFNIDEQELRAEALLGFSDGINSFRLDKDASLKTFLSLCVQRRMYKYIDKCTRSKYKVLNSTVSLDYKKEDSDVSLIDVLSDENKNNPLENLSSLETVNEILEKAKEELSSFEYEVFIYMVSGLDYVSIAKKMDKLPKQIDNTIQRIKTKMRKIIGGNI